MDQSRCLINKQEQLEYKNRDHALFIAYAPVSDPKYAISVVVEHGGTGSSAAAPIAKKDDADPTGKKEIIKGWKRYTYNKDIPYKKKRPFFFVKMSKFEKLRQNL